MARPLVTGMVLQCTIVSLVNSQVAENVAYFKVGAITGTPIDQNMADAVDTAIASSFRALLGTNASYRGVLAQIIWPLPIYRRVGQNAGSGSGTAGAPVVPAQTSGVLSWVTERAGPGFRGRMYVPYPSAAFLSGSEFPTSAYVTALGVFAGDLNGIATIGTGGDNAVVTHSLFNRRTKACEPILSWIPRSIWGTQKKRGDYGKVFTAPI